MIYKGILDYAAEADLDEEEGGVKKTDVITKVDVRHGDSMTGRVYEYQTEAACDANTEIFKECIQSVADLEGDTFAAIKITALGNPLLLQRMSTCIVILRELFMRLDKDGSGRISAEEWAAGYDEFFKGRVDPNGKLGKDNFLASLDTDNDGHTSDLPTSWPILKLDCCSQARWTTLIGRRASRSGSFQSCWKASETPYLICQLL